VAIYLHYTGHDGAFWSEKFDGGGEVKVGECFGGASRWHYWPEISFRQPAVRITESRRLSECALSNNEVSQICVPKLVTSPVFISLFPAAFFGCNCEPSSGLL
jgi:hypothetical protein